MYRRVLAISTFKGSMGLLLAAVFSLGVSLMVSPSASASITNTRADSAGTVELAANGWLGGAVDVYSNGNSSGNTWGQSYVTVGGAPKLAGDKWQCVELINRLYLSKGWMSSTWYGNGNTLKNSVPSGLNYEANGNVNSLEAGDVVTLDDGGFGHAGVIESVNGSSVRIVNQNTDAVYSTASFSNKTLAMNGWLGYTIQGVVHKPASSAPPTSPAANASASSTPLHGNWVGDAREDFAYVSRRSDNGFVVAIQKSTATGLQWQGAWWDVPGTSGVTYDNTVFIPADMDNDGLTDLYYATASNWNNTGFTVALMHNNGNGFDYWGSQWAPTNLKLSETRFLPGNWSGDGREEFAYETKRSDGGFSIAAFESQPQGLVWTGLKWDSPGSSGVLFDNTVMTPADIDNDGLSDLYYSTASNWNNAGFTTALMQNSGSGGFSYSGPQWAPTGLKLSETRLIPGNWAGDAREEFAYVTKRSDNGYSLAWFETTQTGIVWAGVKWDSPGASGVQFNNTKFVPADENNDGLTDLYYVTAANWDNPGFAMGLMSNNGSALNYSGTAWAPNDLKLKNTLFLPQN